MLKSKDTHTKFLYDVMQGRRNCSGCCIFSLIAFIRKAVWFHKNVMHMFYLVLQTSPLTSEPLMLRERVWTTADKSFVQEECFV